MLDKEQFEYLYTKHYGSLTNLARALLHDEEESHDVVSEVMLRVYSKGIPVDTDPAKFLYVCVRNKCMDVVQRMTIRQRIERMLPIDDTTLMTDFDEQQDKYQRLLQIVNENLTEQTRRVFTMRFDNKMSYQQIAETLDISKAAVYKHLKKAIDILKKEFK